MFFTYILVFYEELQRDLYALWERASQAQLEASMQEVNPTTEKVPFDLVIIYWQVFVSFNFIQNLAMIPAETPQLHLGLSFANRATEAENIVITSAPTSLETLGFDRVWFNYLCLYQWKLMAVFPVDSWTSLGEICRIWFTLKITRS